MELQLQLHPQRLPWNMDQAASQDLVERLKGDEQQQPECAWAPACRAPMEHEDVDEDYQSVRIDATAHVHEHGVVLRVVEPQVTRRLVHVKIRRAWHKRSNGG
jgi:hypothetical protein